MYKMALGTCPGLVGSLMMIFGYLGSLVHYDDEKLQMGGEDRMILYLYT